MRICLRCVLRERRMHCMEIIVRFLGMLGGRLRFRSNLMLIRHHHNCGVPLCDYFDSCLDHSETDRTK